MNNSPLTEVNPEFCVYKLDKVFNAAVDEHTAYAKDLARSYHAGSAAGVAQNKAMANRAMKVIDALQAFKDAGKNYIMTKYPLENNLCKPAECRALHDQLQNNQVVAVKMHLPSPV